MEMRTYIGEDEVDDKEMDEHSPGGIVHESLSNIRTVASLTLEAERSDEYDAALVAEDPNPVRSNLLKGSLSGIGQYVSIPIDVGIRGLPSLTIAFIASSDSCKCGHGR
jgi:hypothetical protein